MKKTLIIAAIVLVVAVVAILLLVGGNLNGLVAKVIEREGSAATGTAVRVAGVDISLRDARGGIAGLRVASPAEFDAEDVFALGDIVLDLDPASLRGEPIVIEELRIEAPVVNVKFLKDGSSNLEALRQRLQAAGTEGAQREGEPAKRLRIERFLFAEGRIEVDASALGLEARSLTLPAIRLENLGGEQGATPDQIARQVLGAVARQATNEFGRSEVSRLIEDQLGESLGDKAKDLLDRLRK